MGTEEHKEMTFIDHLEELRWHIIRSIAAVIIFAIAAFSYRHFIFDTIILAPKNPDFWTNDLLARISDFLNTPSLKINSAPLQLINIDLSGQFTTHITVSIITGIIVAFPYIIFEIWRFVKPALHDNERQHTRGGITVSTLLFFIGVAFGYYLIVPLSVHFLGSYNVSQQVLNQINLRSYIGTVTNITLATGITFELPIVIYFLSKIGVTTPEMLKKYRKHAFVATLVLSAIITPPDIFSQVLVCLPLVALYEVGIIISRIVTKHANNE